MSGTTTLSASDLARLTPAGQDRYVDFLRIAAARAGLGWVLLRASVPTPQLDPTMADSITEGTPQ
ncbi:MAG: hypothetical protein ABWZ15_13515 [Acidimicrobiia bacterium]